MVHDLGRDRSQEHRLDHPVSSAPDDDEVGLHPAGLIDDRRRRSTTQDDPLELQARSRQLLASCVDGLLRGIMEIRLDPVGLNEGASPPRAAEDAVSGFDRLRHDDLAVRRPGSVRYELDGEPGWLGTIDRDEDSDR